MEKEPVYHEISERKDNSFSTFSSSLNNYIKDLNNNFDPNDYIID